MTLFRRRKGRYPHEWAPGEIAGQMVAAVMSDPELDDACAGVVFHLDPALIPEDMDDLARREAEQYGIEYTGLARWPVFKLAFLDDQDGADRIAVFVDGDPTALIRDVHGCHSLEEALQVATAFVGDDPQQVAFRSTPGVFQKAIIERIMGSDLEPTPADLIWAPIEGDEDWIPCRRFPAPVKGSAERTESEAEGKWNLLPRAAVEAIFAERGW